MESVIFNQEYLDRLKNGDPDTERHFARHFRTVMWLKMRGKLRSPQSVEEAIQDTFLRVLRVVYSPRGLDSPESLPAFVHKVCNNVMMEWIRKDMRHPQIPETLPDPVDCKVDLDESLVSEERQHVVREILDDLPERDRRILRMVFFEEVDKAEICRQFGVDAGYLRVLLHRAKQRFRKSLGQAKGHVAR